MSWLLGHRSAHGSPKSESGSGRQANSVLQSPSSISLSAAAKNLDLQSFSPTSRSYASEIQRLSKLVLKLVEDQNPSALRLLNMLENMASQLKALSKNSEAGDVSPGARNLPDKFGDELEALAMVVEAQTERELREEEKESVLVVKVLFFREDSTALGEFVTGNLKGNDTTIGQLRVIIGKKMGYPAEVIVIKHKGVVFYLKDDAEPLRLAFGVDFGDVVVNACTIQQAIELGFIEFDESVTENLPFDLELPPSMLRVYNIRVIIPLENDVEELEMEDIEKHTDIGEIREIVAEQINVDANLVILKYKGQFLFPNDDILTVGEVFKDSVTGNSPVKDIQLTAFDKRRAIEMGVINDYTVQLMAYQRGHGRYPLAQDLGKNIPIGGVEIPYMTGNGLSNPLTLELHSEEERLAVERFIEEQRKKKKFEDQIRHGRFEDSPPKAISDLEENNQDLDNLNSDVEVPPQAPFIAPPPPPPPPAPPLLPAGIPLPPPPPTSLISGIESSSKCRMFHWEKCFDASQETIWHALENLGDFHVDVLELEELFAKKKKHKVKKVKRKGDDLADGLNREEGNSPQKRKLIRLPDPKQSQNLEIMLRKLPEIPLLLKGIKDLDPQILDRDTIELMFQNFPKDEDFRFVSELKEDIDENSAESSVIYIHCLSKFPNWDTRLKVWKFTLDFQDRYKDTEAVFLMYETTLNSLLSLKSLQFVLSVVLLSGNEMNRGTHRGGATGFRIDSLLKLSSTKSTSTNVNLLDFIVRQLRNIQPESLAFASDMYSLQRAIGKQSLDVAFKAYQDLEREHSQYFKIATELSKQLSEGDAFLRTMHCFSEQRESLPRLQEKSTNICQLARKIILYFGLSVDEAEKMFKELYPPDLNQQLKENKLQQAELKEWDEGEIIEVQEELFKAYISRKEHRENKENSEKLNQRRAFTSSAKKKLQDWLNILSVDTELLKGENFVSSSLDSGAESDIRLISEIVRNLFRLLTEFADQFADSVHRLMNPPKVRRLKFGKKTSLSRSSVEVTGTLNLESITKTESSPKSQTLQLSPEDEEM